MNRRNRAVFGILAVAVAVLLLTQGAKAIPVTVDLASTRNFAVLAGSGITVAGAVNSNTINGDIGTFPTPSITPKTRFI